MEKRLKIKQAFKAQGSYVIKTWDADKVKSYQDTLKAQPLFTSKEIKNLIVTGTGYGVDILTRALGGDTTYQVEIDSAKIGTGTNTPAASDTDLQTAVLSGIAVASVSYPGNGQVIISFFIPNADLANNTYTEFGIFANSRLFARSLITPNFTKGSNQNTTVDYTITLTAS